MPNLLDLTGSFCKWPDCDNYKEGNTDYCATHNLFLRKQAKEALKPQKQIKPIAQTSKKMAKNLRTYSEKKKKHLEEHPDCQLRLLGCTNNRETNTIHHSGKRGANLNKEELFLTACDYCHNYVERVMSAADRREKGFLI